ncbi:MAG TPA: sugar phosphate nucleotidyltransferase [Bacteroidota bacterium]|nr:sugar phosphate nucleotidyltransferase [Bacteroidota bacterium]
MLRDNSHLWGIVLAAGDGVRLQQYIRERFNSDRPKQYCVFTGTRSMLAHTIARAESLIPRSRLLVTIKGEHREYSRADLDSMASENIIPQPANKETTASILLPLLHILRRDPEARVVTFPSDHFIVHEERFMEHVSAAEEFAESHPKYLILLGTKSEDFLPDYGWIEMSMKIAEVRGCEIFRVKRFLEKPDARKAHLLQKDRTVCNTFVLVGSANAFLRKFRLVTPSVFQAFKRINAELNSPSEDETIQEVYNGLPAVDFSKAILAHDPHGLAVMRVRDVYWNDWGSPGRIRSDLERLKAESEF